MEIQLPQDLVTEALREQCARILYDAFGLKLHSLELFSSSQEKILRLLQQGIRAEQGMYAMRGEQVLGVLGLQTRDAKFMAYPPEVLRQEFGGVGGLLRQLWLGLMALGQTPPRSQLRIAMVAVDESARGSGVGTLLLQAAIDKARREGFRAVVREVVDTNAGARRLYERLGFRRVSEMHFGAITARAGFSGFQRMQLDL